MVISFRWIWTRFHAENKQLKPPEETLQFKEAIDDNVSDVIWTT